MNAKTIRTVRLSSLLGLVFVFSVQGQSPTDELSKRKKAKLTRIIDEMSERDDRYRSVLQLGTLDENLLKREKELSQQGNIQAYMAFTKTVEKTLTPAQEDSLIRLQDALDRKNYQTAQSIIKKHGYPSQERLGLEHDPFTPILLHFPKDVDPAVYLSDMNALLLPEVKAHRMKAMDFARFNDNLRTRFLNQPQVYGTIRKFNIKTMTPGLPEIEDIKATNALRQAIGLEALKAGAYEIKED
ncbi:MAG: hypothetical protein AAF598_17410 [Bacteroidota bacterium]